VIVGEVDVPLVIVHAVAIALMFTPESATAPHTNPEAPDVTLFPPMVALLLGVKPVICHIANEGVVVSEVISVTVPPPVRVMLFVLNPPALVPEILNRT
jgi:hypothetical protein